MNKDDRIYVAGHNGLVGSAIMRKLRKEGYTEILTRPLAELDLRNQRAVDAFFRSQRPDYIFLAAARVGGIVANNEFPADFIYDNLMIECNVIDAARRWGARKLLFLGSSCIYPKFAPQPIKEESLLSGDLEPTNQWYAVAKIAGLKLVQALRRQHGFNGISVMPTNLYGPGDNFDLQSSHVVPALIRKFHEAAASGAPSVGIWGTGTPKREFLHVDDLADALLFLMEHYDSEEIINVGVGRDISIAELAGMIREIVGFEGKIEYDTTKPDGTPRKMIDVSRLERMGWKASISLRKGLEETYQWYVANGSLAEVH